MILINQELMHVSQLDHGFFSKEKMKIIELMGKYSRVYHYHSIRQLEFELEMRIQIIRAAELLSKSGAKFSTFSTSNCNENYWLRTEQGAFFLKPQVMPQTAIEDIFVNGDKYAFECATAIVIVFYKAVLETIDNQEFNRLFTDLFLYDWQHEQDLDLRIDKGTDFLPGDCVYFKNPEFDPRTPWWQGENAIVVDKDLYYGHGIGIQTGEIITQFLNSKRKNGAVQSAFLLNEITRINLDKLIHFQKKKTRDNFPQFSQLCHSHNLIVSQIGAKTYLL